MKKMSLNERLHTLAKIIIITELCVFALVISLFSIKNTKFVSSIFSSSYREANDEEIEEDHWEISTVFYDSTVNDGHTPLTSIDWDASNGGYTGGTSRIIMVQINYKNTNTISSYNPGDLKIKILNLKYYGAQITTTINMGANDSTHSGYDWTFEPYLNNTSSNPPELSFVNAKKIEQNTNLEGSIQIEYTMQPQPEITYSYYTSPNEYIEKFDDSCLREFSYDFKATLEAGSNSYESNTLSFQYRKLYEHPWSYYQFPFYRSSEKLEAYDGIENGIDYYWVKYNIKENSYNNYSSFSHGSSYPYIGGSFYIEEVIPFNCIVLDETMSVISPYDRTSNTYRFTSPTFYVGYPKSYYNSQNNNKTITSTEYMYVDYEDNTSRVLQNTKTLTINLDNYNITPPSNLYSLSKYFSNIGNNNKNYYENLIGEDINLGQKGIYSSTITASFVYIGEKTTIKVGDDFLFITGLDDTIRKLEAGEYFFSQIIFPEDLRNNNSVLIEYNKYEIELYIRRGNNNYELYDTFNNSSSYKRWTFNREDNISGFYFSIKELNEGIKSFNIKSSVTINNAHNIPENGEIYNIAFMDTNKNDIYYYNSDHYSLGDNIPNNDIEEYDMLNFNHLVKRYIRNNTYNKYSIKIGSRNSYGIIKEMNEYTQDIANEEFRGTTTLTLYGSAYTTLELPIYDIKHYGSILENKYKVDGWEIYDLLPKGMNCLSTEEDIFNSISVNSKYAYSENSFRSPMFFTSSGEFISKNELLMLIKDNTEIIIDKNYHNTGRNYIHIKIDLSSYHLIYAYDDSYGSNADMGFLDIKYNHGVPFDSFLEYGNVWTNVALMDFFNKDSDYGLTLSLSAVDDGITRSSWRVEDLESSDINNNGSTEDLITGSKYSSTIKSIISTNQDVQVSVQSDQSTYDTGKVDSSLDSNYSYKLRVRTGTNDVTNLVIYDSLERYAMNPSMELVSASGTRNGWKGDFLGVDTSYAEGKGYTVKTYYSESDQPGSLSEDDSWNEFTNETDRSIVKSLAFEYLDEEGNPATLPANSLTYVLINMKSPNQNLKTFAYNGCWTEWNAIDSSTGETVDFITGINSNIVRVGLPNSVEPEDISITVDKYWEDNHDELGVRPDNITIMIIPNGNSSNSIDYTMTSSDVDSNNSDHWFSSYTVPKYDADGELITYTVSEDTVENGDYVYAMSISGNTITNRLNKIITITKVWVDNHNAYLTRPGNVKVYVSRTDMGGRHEVTITGNYSTDTWSNYIALPVYDTNNDPITYYYQEDAVTDYTSTFDSATVTFTNTLSKNMDIQLTKEWFDNNNEYETRPSSLVINLLQNNTPFREVTLTGDSNIWTSSNQSVPMYDSNGVKYTYTISEGYITSYNVVEYDQAHYKVTNTLKENMDLIITKNWIDNHNEYDTRPESLVINVKRNGSDYQSVTLSGDSDTWTSTITVPKYDNNQVLYEYTLEEENDDIILEYSDISYEDYSITNRLSRNENLTISKIWNDYDNQYLTRPESVNIKLYQNDVELETMELNSENEWQIVKEDMPVYDENGVKYSYTIFEEGFNERYGNITYDQTTLTVTNELTDIPSVTLYFTVQNGYMSDGELKFDNEGYLDTISGYNLSGEEYTYHFELVNVDTGIIYNGSLSTTGILQFDNLPYGTYKAVEKEDDYFDFVSMLSIEDIPGVTFTEDGRGGIITISPTGNNILFGANIINKIERIINPQTIPNLLFVILLFMITIGMLVYVNYHFYQKNKAS